MVSTGFPPAHTQAYTAKSKMIVYKDKTSSPQKDRNVIHHYLSQECTFLCFGGCYKVLGNEKPLLTVLDSSDQTLDMAK